MIKHLKIKNFKSIRDLELPCRRVNILIGEPNSGKSNFIESLALFAVNYNVDLHALVRFENIPQIFYYQDLERPIQAFADELSYEIRYQANPNSPYIFTLKRKETALLNLTLDTGGGITGAIGSEYLPIRPYFVPREPIKRFVENRPVPILWPPHGDNLLSILSTNKPVRELASNLIEKFGLKFVLKPIEKQIELQRERERIAVAWPYWMLSDTLQRVIFYYAAIHTNKEATLLFEEPEAHAFPYYTKFLGEKIAMDTSNQYFIATHNHYLLFPILDKTPKEDINVIVTYFEKDETRIKILTDQQIAETLALDSGVFFNLDEFIGK